MGVDDPVGDIVRLRILGHSYSDIQDHLEAEGYTISESRVKQIVNRIGQDTFDWIREEHLQEAAQTILDYRTQVKEMMEIFNRRFIQAQQEYDTYRENKHATLAGLFEEYRNDPDPDPQKYARRAYAISEGQDLKKLSGTMKKLSSEMHRWSDFGAKIDETLTEDNVNITEINVESTVNQIFEVLCQDCRNEVAELDEQEDTAVVPP